LEEELSFDPRYWQIGVLLVLLGYGVAALGLDVAPANAVLILVAALGTQWIASRAVRIPFDPRSALISGLSLCLLLRTGEPLYALAAAVIAVGSKFLIRVRNKHLFNPTNLALMLLLLLDAPIWVSPGQWGSGALFGFMMASLGGLVVNRALRSDVSYAFLASYLALVFGRTLWLGEPLAIPVHRLENGALILFSFFMISDPKTTPDARNGRILYGALVALGAAYVQFRMYRSNGLLWSLLACSPVVPLIDLLLRGPRHAWRAPKGCSDVANPLSNPADPPGADLEQPRPV
jgi:Na+-transporting NADH:ubiquinone oxidoreductase subunit NqrB